MSKHRQTGPRNLKRRREAADNNAPVSLLVMERHDVAQVMLALENGKTVRAKVAVGPRRAEPAVLQHLGEQVQRLGGRFTTDSSKHHEDGERWLWIEPGTGTGRHRATISD